MGLPSRRPLRLNECIALLASVEISKCKPTFYIRVLRVNLFSAADKQDRLIVGLFAKGLCDGDDVVAYACEVPLGHLREERGDGSLPKSSCWVLADQARVARS